MTESQPSAKRILFEREPLPEWARLLDLAAMISPNSPEVQGWFSRFTSSNGVDDARSVVATCELLRANLHAHRQTILTELGNGAAESGASAVLTAWICVLDVMIQKASRLKTCSWLIEQSGDKPSQPCDGSGLKLRGAGATERAGDGRSR